VVDVVRVTHVAGFVCHVVRFPFGGSFSAPCGKVIGWCSFWFGCGLRRAFLFLSNHPQRPLYTGKSTPVFSNVLSEYRETRKTLAATYGALRAPYGGLYLSDLFEHGSAVSAEKKIRNYCGQIAGTVSVADGVGLFRAAECRRRAKRTSLGIRAEQQGSPGPRWESGCALGCSVFGFLSVGLFWNPVFSQLCTNLDTL
jgi:hypothetical protein